MTRRATLRGPERTPLAGEAAHADVLICGASFAGLAVARALAGSGADVLVVDRYAIGERQTSACAAPTVWLEAMGVREAIRQEIGCMAFHTPRGSSRHRLPWSWSSFDYPTLCEELWAQCGDARFEIATVQGRSQRPSRDLKTPFGLRDFVPPDDVTLDFVPPDDVTLDFVPPDDVTLDFVPPDDVTLDFVPPDDVTLDFVPPDDVTLDFVPPDDVTLDFVPTDDVTTDRGELTAPLVVDALGWRRILAPGPNVQPPEAAISRGLEVHPEGGGTDLDVWIDRSLIRRGYAWSVPAAGEQRVGVGSYEPRDHVREPTVELAGRLEVDAVRYQGNWFPHRLRAAVEGGICFVGDSAGHCYPLSGEGIRTAFYFGTACGRELRGVVEGDRTREEALVAYGAFSTAHAPAFARAYRLQQLIPALPPALLTRLLALMGRRRLCDRAFGWYLDQAHPRLVTGA